MCNRYQPYEFLLVLLLLLCAHTRTVSAQEIGLDICACQPSVYEFTLDFDLTCADLDVGGPGISDTTCLTELRGQENQDDADLRPVSISQVSIFELDQNLDVIAQTVKTGTFLSGSVFTYTSIIATEPDQLNPDSLPRGIQLVFVGRNSLNQAVVNTYAILYNNDCGVFPLLREGQVAGWSIFTDLGNPPELVCPLAVEPSAAPTISMMPSLFPSITPSLSMEPSPEFPTDTPTFQPTDAPASGPPVSIAPATPELTLSPSMAPSCRMNVGKGKGKGKGKGMGKLSYGKGKGKGKGYSSKTSYDGKGSNKGSYDGKGSSKGSDGKGASKGSYDEGKGSYSGSSKGMSKLARGGKGKGEDYSSPKSSYGMSLKSKRDDSHYGGKGSPDDGSTDDGHGGKGYHSKSSNGGKSSTDYYGSGGMMGRLSHKYSAARLLKTGTIPPSPSPTEECVEEEEYFPPIYSGKGGSSSSSSKSSYGKGKGESKSKGKGESSKSGKGMSKMMERLERGKGKGGSKTASKDYGGYTYAFYNGGQ